MTQKPKTTKPAAIKMKSAATKKNSAKKPVGKPAKKGNGAGAMEVAKPTKSATKAAKSAGTAKAKREAAADKVF